MAITIQQQPTTSQVYSVGNPIECLVSSNLTWAANFKFQVKVYGNSTLLATLRYDIIPNTTQAYINISNILKSKIAENITNLISAVPNLKNETLKFHSGRVDIQEYYGTIPAVASGSVTTGNTFYFYNGSLKFVDWQRGDLSKYRINSASGVDTINQRFLTKFNNFAPVSISVVDGAPLDYFAGQYPLKKITSTQFAQLQYLWEGSSGTQTPKIRGYTATYSNTYVATGGTIASTPSFDSLNYGVTALLAMSYTGSLDDTTKYLAIAVGNATSILTGCYLFEIDWSPCSRFDSFEIHWLNSLGGWDNWVFNKRSTKETIIKRKSFNPTVLPISGSTIVHNTFDISNKNFIVSTSEKYKLNSDWLKQADYAALEDLITSPLVYWKSTDGFVNIAISNPETFVKKTNTVDKLISLSFEFEIDNQDRRQ